MAKRSVVSRLLDALTGRGRDEKPNRFQDLNIGTDCMVHPKPTEPGFENTRPMNRIDLPALAAELRAQQAAARSGGNSGPAKPFAATATRPETGPWQDYQGGRKYVGDGEITRFNGTTGNFGDDNPRTGNSPEARREADRKFAKLAQQARENANATHGTGGLETPEQAAARIARTKAKAAGQTGHGLDQHLAETLKKVAPPVDKRTRSSSGP